MSSFPSPPIPLLFSIRWLSFSLPTSYPHSLSLSSSFKFFLPFLPLANVVLHDCSFLGGLPSEAHSELNTHGLPHMHTHIPSSAVDQSQAASIMFSGSANESREFSGARKSLLTFLSLSLSLSLSLRHVGCASPR